MANNIFKNTIQKFDLCIGCGICVALSEGKGKLKINEKGFYEPEWSKYDQKVDKTLNDMCPGIRIKGHSVKGIWGSLQNVYTGWSQDEDIRFRSASGGIVTSLAIYLLETNNIDAVLQIGKRNDDCLLNEMKISTTRQEIIENASSRYAPAPTFVNLLDILNSAYKKFLFVGKPCDIDALQNFLSLYPSYKERFPYLISIFCAGIPSYNATLELCKASGNVKRPKFIKYRGNGWPGNFEATWSNDQKFSLSYDESWGKHLGRSLGYRCKICPDGIGLLADLAIGDSWNTKDGYPDFTEKEGISFILSRTIKGEHLLKAASDLHYIKINKGNIDKLSEQQCHQFSRRKLCGWRLMPLILLSKFKIHFNKLSIIRSALSENLITGIRNIAGSFIRLKHGK